MSVVPSGERIAVKTATRENACDDNETVTHALPPQLVATALRAVEQVGLRLGGVDVIAGDAHGTGASTDATVIEVNGTPGLSHHRLVADRAAATPVAVPILERLLTEAEAR
jgi:D-alanine-D-alanine ligase-like ATP-grasp enzyme